MVYKYVKHTNVLYFYIYDYIKLENFLFSLEMNTLLHTFIHLKFISIVPL